jgi:ketosteroid isomerase-like protein
MAKKRIAADLPDAVEAAYYEALHEADLERLMACWSDEDESVCIHPGGVRLVGLNAIRASYEAILNSGPLDVHPSRLVQLEWGGSAVMHTLLEQLDVQGDDGMHTLHVWATHVFAKTSKGWRLVLHHASPSPPPSGADAQPLAQRSMVH